MHIEKMENGLSFPQGTLYNVPPLPQVPRTVALSRLFHC